MKRIVWVAVVAVSLLTAGIFSTAGSAAPGKEDPQFGFSRGHTIIGAPKAETESSPRFSLGLADGSTISAEMVDHRAALIRRGPDGSPANTFGKQGTLLLPFIGGRKTSAEMLAAQGSSTLALTTGNLGRSGSIYVQRFNTFTGKRDLSFGNKGLATLAIGSLVPKLKNAGFDPIDIELDRKKRIYVAGQMESSPWDTVLVRLTSNGKIDRSFWRAGVVQVFRRDCDPMVDMAVTRAGVFLTSPDCIRLYEETGKLDESFDYRPSGGGIKSLVTGPGGSIHLALTNGGDQIYRIQRLNPDGSLDRSFGSNGDLFAEWPDAGFASLIIDEFGRLVLVGHTYPNLLSIARYTANGAPDSSFGGTGFTSFDTGGNWEAIALKPATVPGGVIVWGSNFHFEGPAISAAKVFANATLDPGFGDGGLLAATAIAPPDDQTLDTINTASGGTIAAGSSGDDAALVRFLPNGRTDNSYGEKGWTKFRFGESENGDVVSSLDRTPEGKTVACVNTNPGAYVVQVGPDGDLDLDFGDAGQAEIPDLVSCSGITATTDGKFLIGGTRHRSKPVVIKLDADGTVDESYGEDGSAVGAWSVTRANGPMAFAGFKNGNALIATPELLTKFGPDGQRVSQFGNGGVVKLTRSSTSSFSDPVTIRVASNGALFVGSTGNGAFMLLKLAANGELIRSFGKDGLLQFKGSSNRIALTDFVIQPDGKPVVSTSTSSTCARVGTCYEKAFVNRFTRFGKLDRKFGRNGTFSARYGVSSRATTLTLTDRGIVVGGYAETYAGREEMMLIRVKR